MSGWLIDLGLLLSVVACPLVAYTEHKVAMAHLGMVLMLIGGALGGLWRVSTPIDLPVFAFVGAMFIAALLSQNPRYAIFPRPWRGDGVLTTFAYAITALVAARLAPADRVFWLAAVWGPGAGSGSV